MKRLKSWWELQEKKTGQPKWGRALSKFFVMPQRLIFTLMAMLCLMWLHILCYTLPATIYEFAILKSYYKVPLASAVECPFQEEEEKDPAKTIFEGKRLDWSRMLITIVLISFYIGYIAGHACSYWLLRFHAKRIVLLGMLLMSLLTVLTPWSIQIGDAQLLIFVRLLIGFGAGITYPALTVMCSHWIMFSERSLLGALALGGEQLGVVLGITLCGVVIKELDWICVYSFSGWLTLCWCLFFLLLCFNTPEKNPYITQKELIYMRESMLGSSMHYRPAPWRAMLRNRAVLIMMLLHFAHACFFLAATLYLWAFLRDMLDFHCFSHRLLFVLPFIYMWLLSLVCGLVSDYLINRQHWSVNSVRRIVAGIGAFLPSLLLTVAPFCGCSAFTLYMIFLYALLQLGVFYAGPKLLPLDLHADYAGALMILANGTVGFSGILATLALAWHYDDATMHEWSLYFCFSSFLFVFATILYCWLGTNAEQTFNKTVSVADESESTESSESQMQI